MAFTAEVGGGVTRKLLVASCQLLVQGGSHLKGLCLALIVVLLATVPGRADTYYVTVAGLGGEAQYVQRFTSDANALNKLFLAGGPTAHVYTLTGNNSTAARLTAVLKEVAAKAKPDDQLVLILIGHGTDDGVVYKYNLVGPDLTGAQIAQLCDGVKATRQIIIDTTSASGGAMKVFEHPGRAIITATKSGTEKNATVFARYLVAALQDPTADLNKDQSISALEAFEYAQRKVADYYSSQQRLATEHPLKNDDRLLGGMVLVRFGEAQKQYADPKVAPLIAQKETLERQIDGLEYRKDALSDDEYKGEMTDLLLKLAAVQKNLDQQEKQP